VRRNDIAQEGQAGAGHANHQVEFVSLQALHEPQSIAMVFERALLYGRRNKGITFQAADHSFDLFGAAALQAENAKACE
jgi:hypothetical protein